MKTRTFNELYVTLAAQKLLPDVSIYVEECLNSIRDTKGDYDAKTHTLSIYLAKGQDSDYARQVVLWIDDCLFNNLIVK